MRKRTEEKERLEKNREIGPSCESCAERRGCALAQEGRFCPRWRAREIPRERTENENPADRWARGEEADID